ncbi:MAG TPA: hypothetical protein VFR68_07175 [Candidatus Dormibacteraeota bacterium]|nr:hypothetical protein [Candidatus Dormibacteraeota bacterium]
MIPRGARAALVAASMLAAGLWPQALVSAGPTLPSASAGGKFAAPTLPSPRGGGSLSKPGPKSVRHRINTLDPAIRQSAGISPAPRTRANSSVLPSGVLSAGTWAPLGPAPIADVKVQNGANPTSDFGPTSGRITSLVTDPTKASTVYAGTAGGGVWKSTDGGTTWDIAITMDNGSSLAIGSIAIDAAGTTIYAATGEDNASGDSQYGAGILKSTDAGVTWTTVGTGYAFATGSHIGGIAVDRNTSGTTETVIIASDTGLNDGVSSGLWISHDSGASWGRITFPSNGSGPTPLTGKTASGDFIEVVQDPTSVSKFWAVASDFCSTETGDIYTSSDSGATWNAAYRSSANGPVGRIAIGVGPSNTAYGAAATCSNFGQLAGIIKSSDGGTSWAPVGGGGLFDYMTFTGTSQGQGWYDDVVGVDPTNANNAYFGGITLVATADGGGTFSDIGQPYSGGSIHPDFHALAFTNDSTFYAGNDGGVWHTTDLGATWSNRNGNLNTTQFYTGVSPDGTHVVGGAQDNGTAGKLPGSPVAAPAWQEYLDGDGGYTLLDPTPGSTTIYASTAGGPLWKGSYQPPASPDPNWPYDTFTDASPCPQPPTPPAPLQCSEPTAFIAPVLMDQTNPSRLLAATTRVYQTTTGGVPAGSSWSAISNSLATATPPAGHQDFIATMVMGTSNTTNNIVLGGSHYGALWMSLNTTGGAASWKNINGTAPNALPAFDLTKHIPGHPWISGIAFNESTPTEIWVTIDGINIGHVWHSTDGGTTWANIDGTGPTGIAPGLGVNGIIYDPTPTATVFVATDLGVVACQTCGGLTATGGWQTLATGLPHVEVDGLSENANHNQLVAWTHGRGAWMVPLGPALDVSPTQLTFTVGEGGSAPPSQTVTVKNDGVGTLTWTAASTTNPPGQTWLQPPSPAAGSDPSGRSTTVTISVVTTGLAAGTYQGTVSFTSNGGSASVAVTLVVPPFPGQYRPVTPYRVVDTRYGPGQRPQLGTGEVMSVQIAGSGGPGGVPAMNSATPPAGVVVNVTVRNPTAPSYLTVYPTNVSRPTVSNLNFVAGQTIPNLVEVALGSDGAVNAFNFQGSTDVIMDVEGWVTSQGTVTDGSGLFHPVVPYRIMDTRRNTKVGTIGTLSGGQSVTLQVTGTGGANGVPSTGVSGVVLNVTAASASAPGYLTVYPSDATMRPTASNVNFVAGQLVPNRVQVKVSATGSVSIYNFQGNTDVIVDVNGWFTDSTASPSSSGQFSGIPPGRILDTRYGPGQRPPLGGNQTLVLQVAGQGGVPAMNAAVPPRGVVLNITVANGSAPGYLTVYPTDASARPLASDLNWPNNTTVPNLVVVRLAADVSITIYNFQGSTDVIVDVFGWYQ